MKDYTEILQGFQDAPKSKKDLYREGLEGREIFPVDGDWIQLDGVELVGLAPGGKYLLQVQDDAYGSGFLLQRAEEVGRFCITDGSIIRVDADGLKWVAPFTKEAQKSVETAGYLQGEVYVPDMFTSQLRFRDEKLHARWVEMCEKAGVKAVDFSLKNAEF